MEKSKLKIEIYEGDPFRGACCGPRITSLKAVERLQGMLSERSQIVERLQNEFKGKVHVEREIISTKRRDYPEYVRSLRANNKPLPYVFLNGEAVAIGKFPSYEEFVILLKSRHSDLT
ncbi:MAG: hypothetical protein OEX76_03360 [Candidatus Bathyarchaeota archaeon]|nr:hypothetical protein [Candidatus Bathyarchaeota archaeon]MDH5712865.1 hypothetical protein [Candidatus Bathyarchaeota archaeon]